MAGDFQVMGVVNVTPDSFSEDGVNYSPSAPTRRCAAWSR